MEQANTEFQQNNGAGNPVDQKTTVAVEDYKNLESFATKSRQDAIKFAKMLAEANPKSIESIDDEKIQQKVIKELHWYDSLDELKIFKPEIFEEESEKQKQNTSEDKRYENLMNLLNKNKLEDEITKQTQTIWKASEAIPDFKDKVLSELKNISSELSNEERVSKAIKLVTGWTDIFNQVLLSLQGKEQQTSWASSWVQKESRESLKESIKELAKKNYL